MTLDAKTLKEINIQIAKMSATGKGITAASRELLTALYAISEGFIGIDDNIADILSDVKGGAFQKKTVKTYLKSLGLIDEVIEKIVDKREEIDRYDENAIKNAKTYRKVLDLIYGTEKDRYLVGFELFTVYDKLKAAVKTQSTLLKSVSSELGDNTDHLYRQLKLRNQLTNTFKNELVDVSELQSHYDTINDVIANITAKRIKIEGFGNIDTDEAISKLNAISKEQLKLLDAEDAARREKLTSFAAWSLGKIVDTKTGDVFSKSGTKLDTSAAKLTLEMIESRAEAYEKLIVMVADEGVLVDELNVSLSQAEKILIKEAAAARSELNIWKTRLQLSEDNLRVLKQFKPSIEAIEAAGSDAIGAFENMVSVIPKSLRHILGIESGIEQAKIANTEAIALLNKSIIETGSITESVGIAFSSWSKNILASVGPLALITTVVIGLFTWATRLSETYKQMSTDIGISVKQAKDLYKANLALVNSQKNQFLTMNEILHVQQAMIESTGLVFDVMSEKGKKVAIQIGEISKAFGYSQHQAVELHEEFLKLGGDDKLALKLQTELGFMSEMAGLSPTMISKDVIENAETLTTYFAGMPDEAARTVLQIRRMGVSLQKAGQLAERMLDLEGFMTDMFELAAMGGPDLSKAFEFGVTGDIENMTKAVMDSIGSLEEFSKMDFFQRKKLADTVGMTTDELANSLMLRKKLANLSKEEQDAVTGNLAAFGKIEDMNDAAIRQRIEENKSLDRLGAAWDKIKATLVRAILPAVEALADTINALSPVIDVVVGIFQGLGLVITGISYLIKGILIPIQLIGKGIQWLIGLFNKVEEPVNAVQAGLGGISFELQDVGKLIGTIVGSLVAFKAFGGLFGGLLSKLPLLGKILTKLPEGGIVGRIFGNLGKLTSVLDKIPGGGLLGKIIGKAPTDELNEASKGIKDVAETGEKQPGGGGLTEQVLKQAKPKEKGTETQTEGKETKSGGWVEKIQNMVKDFGKVIKSGIKLISGIIRTAMEEVRDLLKEASKVIITLFSEIGKIADSVIRTVAGTINTVLIQSGKLIQTTLGIITSSVNTILKAVPNMVTSIMSAIDKVVAGIGRIAPKIVDTVTTTLDKIVSGIGKVATRAVNVVTSVIDSAISGITKLIPKVTNVVNAFINGIMSVLSNVATQLGSVLQTIATTIINVAETVISKLLGAGKTILDGVSGIMKSAVSSLVDITKTVVDGLSPVIRNVVTLITDVVDSVVNVLAKSLQTVGTALGEAIKSLLTSIGDGLSSFGPKALKGAATMLVLSGALWVTSKALQNFSSVSWGDVMKGVVSLGALAGAAMLMGQASGNMLLGAVTIAALGAALIPAAYALSLFADVEWESLAKAGVALIGLGVVASVLSGAAPMMIVGAAALAVLGAALIPMAFAMQMFNSVEWESLGKAAVAIIGFSVVASALSALAVPMIIGAAALGVLGASMVVASIGFNMMASVDWKALDGAGMAILKIGGAAAILGVAAPFLVLGSIALAAFGMAAGTIASGMNVLGSVDWSVLSVIGDSLLKFSVSMGVFGLASPLMLAGAFALGVLGSVLGPFATAIKGIADLDYSKIDTGLSVLSGSLLSFGKTVAMLGLMSPALIGGSIAIYAFGGAIAYLGSVASSTLDSTTAFVGYLKQLQEIDAGKIAGIGGALGSLGLGLAGLGAGNILAGISQLFGGDPFKKLIQLAEIASPLDVASRAISVLGESLIQLSNALAAIDLSKLSELHALQGVASNVGVGFQMRREAGTTKVNEPSAAMTAQNVKIAEPEPPGKEATAQNVSIRESRPEQAETAQASSLDSLLEGFSAEGGTKRLEALIVQLIKVVADGNNRPMVLQFDDGTVRHLRNKTRALNNNR